MSDSSKELQARLANLSPEVRARVEQTLKQAIDKELVTEQGIGAGRAGQAAQFSRGVLFSKSGASLTNIEEIVLPAITEMDDTKFQKFMDRISSLKSRTPGSNT